MGFNWKRVGAAVFTGGASELVNKDNVTAIGRATGLSPGKLPQERYQSPDPYAEGNGIQWDSTGRPIGQMPRGGFALDYQYEADRRTEQRRQALWGDAQNTMRQGMDLMQSYRPGGSAALASGMYGQSASLYGQQAMSTESPDLLMGYREHQQDLADRDRKQAEKLNRTMSIINAGASIAGMAGGGAGVGMAASALQGGQAQMGATNADGQTMAGPGWSQQQQAGPGLVGGPNPIQAPGGGQQMMQSTLGGMGGGGGTQEAVGNSGGYGAGGGGGMFASSVGGGGGKQASSQGGSEMNQRMAGSGGGAPGAGAMPGGSPPLSTFASQEAAANMMGTNPIASDDIYQEWADSPKRMETTYLMLSSARNLLVEAMYAR